MVNLILVMSLSGILLKSQVNANDSAQLPKSTHFLITNSNESYRKLNAEIERLKGQSLSKTAYDGHLQTLFNKYEGAEATYTKTDSLTSKLALAVLPQRSDVKEIIYNGGINSFATTTEGLRYFSEYYSTVALVGGGAGLALTGASAGAALGPVGSLVGIVGGVVATIILHSRYSEAQKLYKKMIGKGFQSGGVRMTLTETFAISTLYTDKTWFI
ncbi:hypothetical protein [Holzapfeliella sp. JNUCC 72]